MNEKNVNLKVGFGIMIFAFALALAYFTASYLQSTGFDYWFTIEAFAGFFVLLGIIVSSIFPVSIGFLFSASILVMNVFLENYNVISALNKALLMGIILIILYITALIKTAEKQDDTHTVAPLVPQQ